MKRPLSVPALRFVIISGLLFGHGAAWVVAAETAEAAPVSGPMDQPAAYDPSVSTFPVDRTVYQSQRSAAYGGTVPIEMVSLSLVSVNPTSVPLPQPGESARVDSFFDVFTEISIDGQGTTRKDSFFDVFVEVVLTHAGQDGGQDTWDTEIVSMSLSGDQPQGSVLIRESPSRASTGRTTIGSLGQGSYSIDSFFDIWTEVSIDGGRTWSAARAPQHLVQSFLGNGPTLPNGISLTSLPPPGPMAGLPLPGSRYQLQQPLPLARVGIELASLCLLAARPIDSSMLPGRPGETARVDSFFDVFIDISVDGGRTTRPDSFFDVFVDLDVTNTTEAGAAAGTGTYETEIISMSLRGGSFPAGVIVRESPTRRSVGTLRTDSSGGDDFIVDSFFDVFTEISVDGGQTWVPAHRAVRLPLVFVPEPVADDPEPGEPGGSGRGEPSGGGRGGSDGSARAEPEEREADTPLLPPGSQYLSNNRTSYAVVDIELVALSLVSVDPVATIPLPQAGQTTSGDSFFDVFMEIDVRHSQAAFMDSFFDVFADLSLGDLQVAAVDSFFDIFTELDAAPDGPDPAAFQTLSVQQSLAASVSGQVSLSGSPSRALAIWPYDVTLTDANFTPVPEIDDEVLTGLRLRPGQTSHGRLTVSNIGPSWQDGQMVDSFFDIWVEISIDGGQHWLAPQGPARLTLSLDRPAESPVIVPEVTFPVSGSDIQYQSVHGAVPGEAAAKIVQLDLHVSDPNGPVLVPPGDDGVMFDSFFDVFVTVEVNDTSYRIRQDRVPMTLGIAPADGEQQQTWDTEILSMSLRADLPGLGQVVIRESPSSASTGHLTIDSLGQDGYAVDSFFDIWTEISLDGGRTFVPATPAPVRVATSRLDPNRGPLPRVPHPIRTLASSTRSTKASAP